MTCSRAQKPFPPLTLFLITVTVMSRAVLADTHYVATLGAHIHPFTNWTHAATNIQAAVSAADNQDEVVVGAGTYCLSSAISVTNLLRIRSASGPAETIVDGQGLCRCFRYSAFGDPDPILDGFTIARGTAGTGGGVQATYGISITNCVITGNSSSGDGGGVHITFGGSIRNTRISQNKSGHDGGGLFGDVISVVDCVINCNTSSWAAGGLSAWDSSVISNCLISQNRAIGSAGGGVELMDTGVIVDSTITSNRSHLAGGIALQGKKVVGCLVADNEADSDGGGIHVASTYSSVENTHILNNRCTAGGGGGVKLQTGFMRNCLVAGNVGRWEGGGVVCSGSRVTLSGCTIAGNIASNYGGGIAYICINAALTNCIIYGNWAPTSPNYNVSNPYPGYTQTYYHCCSSPLLPAGIGNIEDDPSFVGPGDFHLAQGSPCIDSGADVLPGVLDLDGVPRPLDGENDGTASCDMGPYEFAHPNADTDSDGIPDGWEAVHSLDPRTDDASADDDRDTFSNRQEYLADTDPMDGNDVLRIVGMTNNVGFRVQFPSSSNRIYSLLFREGLLVGSWTVVPGQSNIPGDGFTFALSDTNATASQRFFRLGVSVP